MSSLFSPLFIKNLIIKNRIVMPPMALDIATERGEVTSRLIEHYFQRAGSTPVRINSAFDGCVRAGVGLIVVEHSYISPMGKAHPRQLGIYDNSLIPGLKVLVDEIHRQGIPIGIQISHAGARALLSPVAPSGIYCPYLKRFGNHLVADPACPYRLSKEEIKQVILEFRDAAIRAKKAGFDLIEIHGAHGYLVNQFYSPLTNHRTDEYGGNLQSRLRFSLEIIKAVREAVGAETPIFFRLGADDRLPNGNSVEESKKAIPLLVEAGVDCLDLSGGICGYLKTGPRGFFNYLAEALKPVTDIPIMVTGGITSPVMAEELVSSHKTDLVGIGRALLADPHWAHKAWKKLIQKNCPKNFNNKKEA